MKKKLYETRGIWKGLVKETKVTMNAITFQLKMCFVVTDFSVPTASSQITTRRVLINYKTLAIF